MLMNCTTCGAEAPDGARSCPSCGSKLETIALHRQTGSGLISSRNPLPALLLLFAGALALALFARNQPQNERHPQVAAASHKQRRVVKPAQAELLAWLTAQGKLRLDEQTHQAWINPVTWASSSAREKRIFAEIFAAHFGSKSHDEEQWADIIDQDTSKELARYRPQSGLTLTESTQGH